MLLKCKHLKLGIVSAITILMVCCTSGGDITRESFNLPDKATCELTELFRISSPTDGAFFSHIRKIHILSDGNLIVQNYPDHQLYELTPVGELVSVIGRQGRGPGEFIQTYISHLTLNDSLHVYDFNNIRHQVLFKNDEGEWEYKRERAFRRKVPDGMREQIPKLVLPGPGSDLYGVFRIFPTSRDTLNGHYAYVSRVDRNVEHMGEVSRLRLEHDLALHRGDNFSLSVHNNRRFYKGFYNFNPETDEVILIHNTSNEIIAIDTSEKETVIGYLPFERFPLDRKKLEGSLVNVNYHYSGMKEIVQDKFLEHEPYYSNVILHQNRLWINLARADSKSPNWIITTLNGEVLKAFRIPENISEVTIHGNRMYGSVLNSDETVYLVGYELKEL